MVIAFLDTNFYNAIHVWTVDVVNNSLKQSNNERVRGISRLLNTLSQISYRKRLQYKPWPEEFAAYFRYQLLCVTSVFSPLIYSMYHRLRHDSCCQQRTREIPHYDSNVELKDCGFGEADTSALIYEIAIVAISMRMIRLFISHARSKPTPKCPQSK